MKIYCLNNELEYDVSIDEYGFFECPCCHQCSRFVEYNYNNFDLSQTTPRSDCQHCGKIYLISKQ